MAIVDPKSLLDRLRQEPREQEWLEFKVGLTPTEWVTIQADADSSGIGGDDNKSIAFALLMEDAASSRNRR